MKIPQLVLRQLYTFGSLVPREDGFGFSLKNRLSDAMVTRINGLRVNGREIPLQDIEVGTDGHVARATEVRPDRPIPFELRQVADLHAVGPPLGKGTHEIVLAFEASPFGALELKVTDALQPAHEPTRQIPYVQEAENFGADIVRRRQQFVQAFTGRTLAHLPHYSFDPQLARGNIENFTGVAQIPIGFAGPLRVNGEHAQGEYLIPLATTEGTLVASYSRGMKLINLCGGVTTTIVDDAMQRAPVFIFDSAREARAFRGWVEAHLAEIRHEAEATSRVAKLLYIDTYLSNKFAFLRFNFTTGDAAGQNMVGRATFAACSWIVERVPTVRRFYLESNLATDKKASQINVMKTRGKRVTAECVFRREHLLHVMRVEPESLVYHGGVANIGALMSGANNNGLHAANAITALFIATGQDVANVSEGAAGLIYSEITADGDLYLSITLPSLIVATHGGGTGLATQRECLEVLDCYGTGKVGRLAEICAGVVLAGEISLASAISSLEWVSAHERYGRHR